MRASSESGIALVLVVSVLVLLSALGAALVLSSSSEADIAANFRASVEASYVAEAAADFAVHELSGEPDWRAVVAGAVRSRFVDGSGSRRTLPDGTEIDLDAAATLLPGGRLYASGHLSDLLPSVTSPYYLTIVVARSDADDRLDVRADAVGPRALRRAVVLTVARSFGAGIRVLSRREPR